MEAQNGEGPDSTSIKPVSSLRSKFETISTSRPAPQSIPSSPTTNRHDLDSVRATIALKKPPPNPPRPRISLDSVSRPTHADIHGQYTGTRERVGSPTLFQSRPQSLIVQSPPRLAVTAPTSPPKHADFPSHTRLESLQQQRPSSPRGPKAEPPPAPAPRHLRFTSRSASRSREALIDLPPADGRAPSTPTTSGISLDSNAVKPAPPINRAAKPEVLRLEDPQRPSTTPPLLRSPIVDQGLRSPFGSSPEPDDEDDQIVAGAPLPPPLPHASKPSPVVGATAKSDAPIAIQSPHSQHPTRISSQPRLLIAHGRRRSRSAIAGPLDQSDVRPVLPPRPLQTEPLIRNHVRGVHSAGSRTSVDLSSRPSALSQGFVREDASALRKASFPLPDPPPEQTRPTIARSTSQTPPPRPSGEIPRSFKADPRPRSLEMETPTSTPIASAVTTAPDYPDSSRANRRPPHFPRGPKVIPTTYDSRLFDISGEFVCTSGTHTRVWSLLTGKLVLTMAHGEQVKANTLAFKPTRNIGDEGKSIWIGTNWGELQEVDVTSKKITALNDTAHARRELVKIFRNGADMWTLDNEGKLLVWPAGSTSTPSLGKGIFNGRVPQGHTTSIAADRYLWLANGRGLYVFQPSIDPAKTHFKVTSQAMQVQGAGDIISSGTIKSQPENVFFGHTDGKISVFSRKSFRQKGLYSVSLHKVTCLVGVGDNLWVGFSTGTIVAYDTNTLPWTVKKYWTTHSQPVSSMISDADSLWKLGRWHVVSLGADNLLGIWDGTLEDDWLEGHLLMKESDFCSYEQLSAAVFTWNAGASKPTDLRHDSNFFRDFLKGGKLPDIMVFGLQELVDLEDKKLTASELLVDATSKTRPLTVTISESFFKSKKQDSYGNEHLRSVYRAWKNYLARCLDEYLPDTGGYSELHAASLVGLFTCVFVKASVRHRIRDLHAAEVKTGMGGLHGNKGALIVRFLFDDSSICFTNCHLAAGQSSTTQRNNDIASILDLNHLPLGRSDDYTSYVCGGDGTMIMDHEICILNGDLNYRIDAMSRDAVVSAIRNQNLSKLLERDQLKISRRKFPGFRLRDFQERPITFQPTYKYDVGTDNYDSSEKRRSPAWCDRILYRGPEAVKQLDYKRHEIRMSDHRPVTGSFQIRIKSVESTERQECRQRGEDKFAEHKKRLANEAKLEYLCLMFGLSRDEAQLRLASE